MELLVSSCIYMVAPFLASLKSWISKHPAPLPRRRDKPSREIDFIDFFVQHAACGIQKASSVGGNRIVTTATTESYKKKARINRPSSGHRTWKQFQKLRVRHVSNLGISLFSFLICNLDFLFF
ncbi:Uncharacterized protein Rs2_32980 [Raphanus sativus]|nr:Uncharacterized protein Rs2_32980 [Raphanus sativus]